MKRIVVLWVFILVVTKLVAQHYTIDLKNSAPLSTKASTINKQHIYNFSYPGIIFKEINTTNGLYNQVYVPGTYRTGKLGEPQLVATQKLISLPADSKVSVKVISYTVDDYVVSDYFVDNKIIPYQPSYSKNENIVDKKLVVKNESYMLNAFSEGEIASVKILGTLRDKRIAKLTINPTSYNPVTNTLRFYNNIEVEVIVEDTPNVKSLGTQKTSSPYFNSSYQKIESINIENSYPNNPDLTEYPVKYLIVAPNNYVPGLKDFIKWKTQKGFEIVVGNLNEIGSTASAIKTWVQNQYNAATPESPAPSFLLLVGDIQQIPASQNGVKTSKATDLYYASVDGDMFPDMYYGRLPAQDTAQLRVMLSKTIKYEKYQFANDSFLDKVTLIAGADPGGNMNALVAQPTIKYGTTNYFNTAHGFSTINSYLNSYTGCYANDKTAVSMINYTAHCSQTTWVGPYLNATTAKTIGISGEYTLAIGNCCQSGDFSSNECIGEAWIRNTNAGAIAYIGSVPDTFWYEDFYWSVGAHDPVANQFPSVSGSSLGVYDALFGSEYQSVDAMIFVGNLAVTEAHNEGYDNDISSQYYWEAYHCLGDPSIIPYLTRGLSNTVTHDNSFRFGLPTFEVTTLPGSTVALSNKNGLIGTTIAGLDGIASVKTDTLTLIDSVTLVVTKPKYKPYIKTLPVGEIVGTYLIVEKIQIKDSLGNSIEKMDFGEKGNLEISIKNIGNQLAENIWVTLTSSDTCLKTMYNNIRIPANNIQANGIITLSNVFNYTIKDFVPDQHNMKFTVTLSDSISTMPRAIYTSVYNALVNAPNFEVLSYKYLDDFSGNGNKNVDYGETATLRLAFHNKGHATIGIEAFLSNVSINKAIQINTEKVSLAETSLNDTIFINFEIQLPKNAIVKSNDTLLLNIVGGKYLAESIVHLTLGQSLFAQLGSDNTETTDYPFNNYYKNNSTQLLFRGTELGIGAKAISSIAFDIAKFTTSASYRDLKNFKIRAAVTNVSELTSKIELINPQLVYSNNAYLLPSVLGWEKFDLETPIIFDNSKNIVFEITWGSNDNFAQLTERTKVYTSTTPFKSVAWGADDYINPAPIINSNNIRPNALFEFDSIGILNLTVLGNLPIGNNSNLANCKVTKGTESKLTDELGRTQFYFLEYSGNYNFNFSTYGYYDTTIAVNKTQTYEHIQVELRRHPELTLRVQNSYSLPVENATITIGGNQFITNSLGEIKSYSTPQYSKAVYSITKVGFYKVTDSILINSMEKVITITLIDKFSDAIVTLQNTKNEPIENATVILNSHTAITDSMGIAIFNGIVPGNFDIQLYHPNFEYYSGKVLIGYEENIISYKLKTVGDFQLHTNCVNNTTQGIDVKFGNSLQTIDSRGIVEFQNVLEGTYSLKIENQNYYPYSDSIHVFGKTTTLNLELKNKADVTFYINNGLTGIKYTTILFDTLSLITNESGLVSLNNINYGTHSYTIKAAGYYDMEGSIEVGYYDTIVNLKLNGIPNLILEIQAPTMDVSQIPVYFENDTLFANSDGIIEFIQKGSGTYHYRINYLGYYQINDSVIITTKDVKKIILLKEIPDLKICTSENGKALDSVKVDLDTISNTTDVLGEAYFVDVVAGVYSFSCEKAGYYSKSGNILITNSDTVVYIEMQQKPDLRFTVLNFGSPVANAKIVIENFILYTDKKGQCELKDLTAKEYIYTVEKPGYLTRIDTLIIGELDYIEIIELQRPEYSVVFTITDGANVLENAKIVFNKSEKLTNENGIAEFNNFATGEVYNFTISKEGYFDYTDSLTVTDHHLTLEVTLKLKTFKVQFQITDENGVVSGANISFDNKVKVTNAMGIATFPEVLPMGEIPYYINKNETHFSDTGFISVKNDTILNVELLLVPIGSIAESLQTIKIFPNPTKGEFFIDANIELVGSGIQVMDNHGKIVYNGIINDLPQKVVIKSAQGVYHINIYFNNKAIRRSIVLE